MERTNVPRRRQCDDPRRALDKHRLLETGGAGVTTTAGEDHEIHPWRNSTMNIIPAGTHVTRRGPAEWFTGTVWVDSVIEAPAPARIRAARVTFEPGARTAWHTHPLGQTLYVLSGVGRVQSEGGPLRSIRA